MKFTSITSEEDIKALYWYNACSKNGRKKPQLLPSLLLQAILLLFMGIVLTIQSTDEYISATLMGAFARVMSSIAFGACVFWLYWAAYSLWFLPRKAIKRLKPENAVSTITLDDTGISTALEAGEESHFYAWGRTDRVLKTPTLYMFYTQTGSIVYFNKKDLQEKEALLNEMIRQKMVGKTVIV